MDIIKNKIKLYSYLIPLFEDYVDKLSSSFKELYELINTIREQIKEVNVLFGKLKTSHVNDAANVFKTMNMMNTVDAIVYDIYKKLDFDVTELPSQMSNTYVLSLVGDYVKISTRYEVVKNDVMINDPILLHTLLEIIKEDPIDKIHSLFMKHTNTVNIYTHYIQHRLNTTDPDTDEHLQIIQYLDIAKNTIINKIDDTKKKMVQCDTIMQRFGLIPMFQHLTLNDVMQRALNVLHYIDSRDRERNRNRHVHGGFSSPELKKIADKFREKKIGLYVMIRITTHQVEYDFSPLMNRKMAEKMTIPKENGINLDIIKKFDLIKNIDKQVDSDYTNTRMGDIKSNKWLIIRTLNGVHYDIMAINKNTLFVDLEFVNRLERGPSLRINNYQRICASQIMAHVKTPQEVLLEKHTTPLQNVSTRIQRGVIEHIDKKLKTLPKSLSELAEYISGSDIDEISSKILIGSYAEFGLEANKELSSTFLYNIDNIIRKFTRKIRESFAQSDMSEFMFKEKTKDALIVHIRKGLSVIIEEAAKKVFDPKQDIYAGLLIKKKLLKIEL